MQIGISDLFELVQIAERRAFEQAAAAMRTFDESDLARRRAESATLAEEIVRQRSMLSTLEINVAAMMSAGEAGAVIENAVPLVKNLMLLVRQGERLPELQTVEGQAFLIELRTMVRQIGDHFREKG